MTAPPKICAVIISPEGIETSLNPMRRAILGNPDIADKGSVVRGCAIFTVDGGKLVERWVNADSWGRALQVGAICS